MSKKVVFGKGLMISELQLKMGMDKFQAEEAVTIILDKMQAMLVGGNPVKLMGVGSLVPAQKREITKKCFG